MRWTEKEIKETINLLKEGKNYKDISIITCRSEKSIKLKMNRMGEGYNKYNPKEITFCLNCEGEIKRHGKNNKFCSQSCSATYNNKLRFDDRYCLKCDVKTSNQKYCSHKCNKSHKRDLVFEKIENGDTTLYFKNYKNYLIHKYGKKCMECGWCEINPYSGRVPIELEHIDGNSTNNSLDNLKLLCPNCHSLTPTYKALNMGNGRHDRMERYHKGKSY
jgi:hypothetical protein